MGGNQVDIAISGTGVRRDATPPRSAVGAPAPQPSSAIGNLTRLR
jgi:hypothetical protein